MKVWIVEYGDRSAIQHVFDSENLAELFVEWAMGGLISEMEVESWVTIQGVKKKK